MFLFNIYKERKYASFLLEVRWIVCSKMNRFFEKAFRLTTAPTSGEIWRTWELHLHIIFRGCSLKSNAVWIMRTASVRVECLCFPGREKYSGVMIPVSVWLIGVCLFYTIFPMLLWAHTRTHARTHAHQTHTYTCTHQTHTYTRTHQTHTHTRTRTHHTYNKDKHI